MHDAYLQTPGAKYASFAPLYTENDHFAKTGSGQTQEKLRQQAVFTGRLRSAKMPPTRTATTRLARAGLVRH